MGQMDFPSFTIDYDIIKEKKDKMTKERVEDMIHETLKSGRCITQIEGHDQEIIMALMILKSSFGNIDLFHMYLVVYKM
jgi:hypothetical protein